MQAYLYFPVLVCKERDPLASFRTDKLFTGELGAAIISVGENKCVTMNCDKPTSCFRKQETTVAISNQYMYQILLAWQKRTSLRNNRRKFRLISGVTNANSNKRQQCEGNTCGLINILQCFKGFLCVFNEKNC